VPPDVRGAQFHGPATTPSRYVGAVRNHHSHPCRCPKWRDRHRLAKKGGNPGERGRGHVNQVRSPRFQLSVHFPSEIGALAPRSFASGSGDCLIGPNRRNLPICEHSREYYRKLLGDPLAHVGAR
jgi:hypothetical protein